MARKYARSGSVFSGVFPGRFEGHLEPQESDPAIDCGVDFQPSSTVLSLPAGELRSSTSAVGMADGQMVNLPLLSEYRRASGECGARVQSCWRGLVYAAYHRRASASAKRRSSAAHSPGHPRRYRRARPGLRLERRPPTVSKWIVADRSLRHWLRNPATARNAAAIGLTRKSHWRDAVVEPQSHALKHVQEGGSHEPHRSRKGRHEAPESTSTSSPPRKPGSSSLDFGWVIELRPAVQGEEARARRGPAPWRWERRGRSSERGWPWGTMRRGAGQADSNRQRPERDAGVGPALSSTRDVRGALQRRRIQTKPKIATGSHNHSR
jgi:hypothetical protein